MPTASCSQHLSGCLSSLLLGHYSSSHGSFRIATCQHRAFRGLCRCVAWFTFSPFRGLCFAGVKLPRVWAPQEIRRNPKTGVVEEENFQAPSMKKLPSAKPSPCFRARSAEVFKNNAPVPTPLNLRAKDRAMFLLLPFHRTNCCLSPQKIIHSTNQRCANTIRHLIISRNLAPGDAGASTCRAGRSSSQVVGLHTAQRGGPCE